MIFFLFILTADTFKITIDEALKIAMKRNPELRIERKSDAQRNVDFVNSLFNFLPTFNAEGSYSNTETKVPTFIPGIPSPIFTSSRKGYTMSFSINQRIFSPSQLTNTLNSYFLKEKGRLSLINYEMRFVYEVTYRYFNLLKTKKILEAMEKGVLRAEENFKIAEEKYSQGLLSYFDYINTKVQMENAILNKKRAEKNYYDAIYDFKYILGEERDVFYEPLDIEVDTLRFKEPKEIKFHEYEAEKWRKRISNLNFIYNLFSFLPEVYLTYYYSYSDSLLSTLFKTPETTKGLYITLSLRFWNYPFNIMKSKIESDIGKENLKRIFIMSKVNYEKALKQIEVMEKTLEVAKEKLKSAEIGYQVASESFRLGKISSIELRGSEENLINSEVDYISALYDYKLSISYYLYLTGNLNYKERRGK